MTIKSVVKRFLDWAILLLWFAAGCLIFVFSTNIQDLALGIALLVLMAMGPMVACLLALRNRKRAAQVFLINGVFATGFLIFLDLRKFADRDNLWSSIFTTCGFAVAFFAVPGIYWLLTARWQWPPYLQHSFSLWTKLTFGVIGLFLLLVGSCWRGLYQITNYGDCSPRLFTAPRYPGHNTYTAKIIYVHHSISYTHSGWSLARTEHKYWGIYGWNQTYTILPYIAAKVGDEYLIEGHIRQSLIGYFLNIMEIKCSLTWPISAAALELHLLQTGPTNDGIRIIGRVLKEDHAGKQDPVPNTSVALVPNHGPEIVQMTDAQGIFDFQKMPVGEYDIRLRTQPVPIRIREYGQCSGPFTSEENIAECLVIIREPAVSQQK